MITKQLGGDRVGSGNKMDVKMHGYDRSTHDLGFLFRTTMSSGTLVPFMSEVGLPGDSWDIDLDADVKTHPTIGPLFGSYKVQLDVFVTPVRLYNSWLHNNKLNIGRNMSQVKLPVIKPTATGNGTDFHSPGDYENSQVNPSALLSYLGIRGIGATNLNADRTFNALGLLTYWDIYKNYYANKQEEKGVMVHTPREDWVENVSSVVGDGQAIPSVNNAPGAVGMGPGDQFAITTVGLPLVNPESIELRAAELNEWIKFSDLGTLAGTSGFIRYYDYLNIVWGPLTFTNWRYRPQGPNEPIQLLDFPLDNIDKMREAILTRAGNLEFDLRANVPGGSGLTPYGYCYWNGNQGGLNFMVSSQQGLGIKTYQSDLFNNWLDTEWIDGPGGINEISAVDVSDGTLKMDSLILARKVYDMLNRVAVSGGTYQDWLHVTYDHEAKWRAETPMYMGGLTKELVFQEVISNSGGEGDGQAQPLGTLAGRGVLSKKHKGGRVNIKIDEHSYITGIVSLTPRVDYSQGNRWDTHLLTMDDFHKPALDGIGFQELIIEQAGWFSTFWSPGTSTWVQRSAGKQPAWVNYMTNVNRVFGNFAIKDNEMFMTLNRRYEVGEAVQDGLQDMTTYIDPAKFNQIFAETSLDSQNFWVQIAVDITARRKMSAKIMPNL